MDIDIIIEKATDLLARANNYKAYETQKTAITGATSGVLTVNNNTLDVDGTDFTDLLDAKITSLGVTLANIKLNLDSINDAIGTELDA